MPDILVVGAAVVFAGIAAWFFRGAKAKSDSAEIQAALASSERRASDKIAELEQARADVTRLTDALRTEAARSAAAEARREAERKASEEKLALFREAEKTLANTFRALSSDALRNNNQSFLELAKATLEKFQQSAKGDLEARHKAVDELVRPLRESLAQVDGKLGEIEKVRLSAYSALHEQMKGLVETHLPMLRNETSNLVKALRQPTVRGRWGEIQLKRVVEMAGMLDHCDFVEQENVDTDDGRFRPDMIVKLPGGKQIVVDSKAAVNAYLDAAEATDDETNRTQLALHARQVRNHMTALGRKAYWEQFDPTPELVIMFLPGEMFFSAALQQDPSLIEFGVNEKVIPATPTTLIALLRAVAYGWRQESLAKNAQEVTDLGRELYERIASLAGHWSDVGGRLDKAVEAYNKSVGTFESRVLVSARRMRDLKAAPEDLEIEPIEPIERAIRPVQAAGALDSPDIDLGQASK